MLLKHKKTGKLVEVTDIEELMDPDIDQLTGCLVWGEEFPDHESFCKASLSFASGEELPKCWFDENFRVEEINDRRSMMSYMANNQDDSRFQD